MSALELSEWAGFERVFGPILIHERIDAAAALIAAVVANASGGKRRGKPFQLKDFLPEWDRGARRQQQSPEELRLILESEVKR